MKYIFSISIAFFLIGICFVSHAQTPASANELFNLAEKQLYKDNNYAQAATTAKNALMDYPDHIGLHSVYATALCKDAKTRKTGLEQFELIIAMYPEEVSLKERYASFLDKENAALATEMYSKVLDQNPNSTKALFYLGQYYADKGNLLVQQNADPKEIVNAMSLAASYFEKYLLLKPNDKNVKITLIEIYKGLRLDSKAAQLQNEDKN